MVKMIDNEPKSVKNRATALKELYNYLTPDEPKALPVKWSEFTKQYKVGTLFSQAVKKLGIVKQIDKQGSIETYIWNVGEPNVAMAAQVLKVEKEITTEISKKKAKKDAEVPKGPRLAMRFPIVIKFRSIFYIQQ